MEPVTLLCAALILLGLLGVAVPVLPGLVLVWAAVLVWALERQSQVGWVAFGLATCLALTGLVLRYLVPGQRLRRAGVTWRTTLCGVAAAVAGFVLVPVVGAVLGFVVGIYAAERVRLGSHGLALPSTRSAVKAVALSVGIELAAGLLIATVWVVAVLLTVA